jgi:multisubunit Na+/H+ antiporter MnhF subunit
VNAWFITALALTLALVPVGIRCFAGDSLSRLVGLQMSSVVLSLLLLVLAQAFGRDTLVDLALTVAFLSFGAGLVFVRFLERWL